MQAELTRANMEDRSNNDPSASLSHVERTIQAVVRSNYVWGLIIRRLTAIEFPQDTETRAEATQAGSDSTGGVLPFVFSDDVAASIDQLKSTPAGSFSCQILVR